MIPHYGILLAVEIIDTSFGDLVGKICNCLLEKGALTMKDLSSSTQLDPSQLKDCLLVLIQHNCVQAFTRKEDDGPCTRKSVEYVALFDNILHRLRFSKFLALIKEKFDPQCELLLKVILEHGRLTFEQLMVRGDWIAQEEFVDSLGIKDTIRRNFSKLVQAHFLERCPKPNPQIDPITEDNPKKKAALGAKVAQAIKTDAQRAVEAASCPDSQRFYFPIHTVTELEKATDVQTSRSAVGEKRKHVTFEMDSETLASVCEKEVLWRANFEAFIRCFRDKACVQHIRQRLNIGAGTVLQAILGATRHRDRSLKIERIVALSMDAILQAVREDPEGLAMTREHVRAALEQIGFVRGNDGLHTIDLKDIIEALQKDEVEELVKRRYGTYGYRLFHLLSMEAFSDLKQVTHHTLMEPRVVNGLLHKLWKENYVHVESLKFPQGSSATCICLWKVNKSILHEHVLNEMYHAALNLSQRLAYELEQERETMMLVRNNMAKAAQDQKLSKIKRLMLVMEASLLKIDDSLMLFHDF